MPVMVEAPPENALRERITQIVAEFLRRPPEEIDPFTPLALYGLDSLTSLGLVGALERAFDRALPEWLLDEHPDIDHLALALSGDDTSIRNDELELMLSDSILPADIHPTLAAPCVEQPRNVLLTGASGFLGAYLLRALLDETEADVYCLVRAEHEDGLARVRRNLERYGLWQASLASRVHAMKGDLTKTNLGLAPTDYEWLCENLDTICHAAADVNWIVPYSALRHTNVTGTRELIRLACERRPKAFHFISSLSVGYAVDGPAMVSEDDDMLPWIDRLPLAYAQSKCVAEALVRQAATRGLNACIHRPTFIAGDSRSGASNPDDLLAALLKGCIQMGAAPDLDWKLDVLPVDHVARAIVRLPQTGGPGLHNFHLGNARPRHWRECVLWMNLFGYPVTLLPCQTWRERLAEEAASPDHALHRLRGFFLRQRADGATVPELYQEGRSSVPDCARTRQAETALGLNCPPLNAELLDRYFSYYVEQGFLPPPTRKGPSTRNQRIRACFEDHDFFGPMLRRHFEDDSLRVRDAVVAASGSEHSIISELTSWRQRRRTGLFHYRLGLERNNEPRTLDVMVKARPSDEEVIEVAETAGWLCNPCLGAALHEFRDCFGMKGGHLRELAIYEEADEQLRRHMPTCFGVWHEDVRGEWGLALEHLEDMALMDSSDVPGAWSRVHIEAAITGLAQIHASWYGRESELKQRPWIGHIATRASMVEMTPLWRALAVHAAPWFEKWAGLEITETHRTLVESIGEWWRPLEDNPRTLIHNDFNTRNIALRRNADGFLLCAYDWELATVGVPQRDLVELLCFVLPPDVSQEEANHYVEFHRIALGRATGQFIPANQWRTGLHSALADLLVNRLAFYAMVHRIRPQQFLPRVVRTWQRLERLQMQCRTKFEI